MSKQYDCKIIEKFEDFMIYYSFTILLSIFTLWVVFRD